MMRYSKSNIDISNNDFSEDLDISDYDPTYKPDSDELDILDDDLADELDISNNYPSDRQARLH